jgi:hypothetical protein
MDEIYIKIYEKYGCEFFCKGNDTQLKEWKNSDEEIRQVKINSVKSHLKFYKSGIDMYKLINEMCGGKNIENLNTNTE